jgi:dienelactone hydrolase
MTLTQTIIEHVGLGVPFASVLVGDTTCSGQRGLLVFPNALGVSPDTLETAHEIAAKGYVVLVVDLYGKDVRPTTLVDGSAAAGPLRKDPTRWRTLMNGALAVLRAEPSVDPKKLGAIGFCFGGSCALELARSGADVRAVASLHGGVATQNPDDAKSIKGSVFVLHGADDPFVPEADLRAFESEMRAAGVDWQLIEFGGTVHSFTDKGANIPGKAVYSPRVVRRAFRMVHDFFDEVLG